MPSYLECDDDLNCEEITKLEGRLKWLKNILRFGSVHVLSRKQSVTG
jgi:hypothetical protein